MSSANIEDQTCFIKEQLDRMYYEGFYEQMLIDDPERLAAEIEQLTHPLSDLTSIHLP